MRSSRRRPRRLLRAFTLLEIMLAVMIGGLLMLTARAFADRIAESARAISQMSRRESRRANADAWLRTIVGQIDTQRDSTRGFTGLFEGSRDVARFSSWCETASGWEERCDVQLELLRADSRAGLRMHSSSFGTVNLQEMPGPSEFRYLLDAGNGGKWLVKWSPAPNAPLAIGIITPRDTTILRIGFRG